MKNEQDAIKIARMMRRLDQLELIRVHYEKVLTEGKRELSGLELWRLVQVAQAAAEVAQALRYIGPYPGRYDATGPDIPGVVELKVKDL